MKRIPRKSVLKITALAIFITLAMSGCGGAEEKLKDMAFVQCIGIDYVEEMNEVSLMIYDISKTSGSSSQLSGNLTRVLHEKSTSLPDAVANVSAVVGKKPFFSHNRVVVIGENAAASGIEKIMNAFYKNAEIRPYILIAVARGEASEILGATFGDALNPAQEIQDIIRVGSYYSIVPETELVDIAVQSNDKTSDVYMPIVELHKEGEDEFVRANGIAVFRQQKLVGELDENESKGLLFVNNKIGFGTLSCETDDGVMVSSEILSSNTDVSVEAKDEDNIMYEIKVRTVMSLAQTDVSARQLAKGETEIIEEAYAKVIEEQIKGALQKCLTEYKSDVFRFGKMLWKKNPDVYRKVNENWRDRLSDIDFKLDIKVSINGAGEEIIDY